MTYNRKGHIMPFMDIAQATNDAINTYLLNSDKYLLRKRTDKNGDYLIAEKKGFFSWIRASLFRFNSYKLSQISIVVKNNLILLDENTKSKICNLLDKKIESYNNNHKNKIDKISSLVVVKDLSKAKSSLQAAGIQKQPAQNSSLSKDAAPLKIPEQGNNFEMQGMQQQGQAAYEALQTDQPTETREKISTVKQEQKKEIPFYEIPVISNPYPPKKEDIAARKEILNYFQNCSSKSRLDYLANLKMGIGFSRTWYNYVFEDYNLINTLFPEEISKEEKIDNILRIAATLSKRDVQNVSLSLAADCIFSEDSLDHVLQLLENKKDEPYFENAFGEYLAERFHIAADYNRLIEFTDVKTIINKFGEDGFQKIQKFVLSQGDSQQILRLFKDLQNCFLRSEIKAKFIIYFLQAVELSESDYKNCIKKITPLLYGIIQIAPSLSKIADDIFEDLNNPSDMGWYKIQRFNHFVLKAKQLGINRYDASLKTYTGDLSQPEAVRLIELRRKLIRELSDLKSKNDKRITKQAINYINKLIHDISRGKPIVIPHYYHGTPALSNVKGIISKAAILNLQESGSPGAWVGTTREKALGGGLRYCFVLSDKINENAPPNNPAMKQINGINDIWIGFQQDVNLNLRKTTAKRSEEERTAHLLTPKEEVSVMEKYLRNKNIKLKILPTDVSDKLNSIFTRVKSLNLPEHTKPRH